MMRLYFLMTLKSESFGHFCDVDNTCEHLRFVHNFGKDSVLATAISLGDSTSDSVRLDGYIQRTTYPRGRLAYVFTTSYKGEPAILKLSWTPMDRMPEGAVYDLLLKAGVEGIPRVYDSGLLKQDFFGLRLEYLILEHCGSSIAEHLPPNVENIVRGTMRCLSQARAKGDILYRDTSLENIMVQSDGTVKVIDWGYAKVVDDGDGDDNNTMASRKARISATAIKWKYNSHLVMANEDNHDPLTGTPLHMSIPVLAGAKVRGLADDIESLFYVILDVLAGVQVARDAMACAFKTADSITQAMVRAGCLSSKASFLRFFGISSCSDKLRRLLCDLRQFLFENSDGYIGSDLIADAETERGVAVGLLKPYVDQQTTGLLLVKETFTPKKSAKQVELLKQPDAAPGSSLIQSPGLVHISEEKNDLILSIKELGKRPAPAESDEELSGDQPGPSRNKPRQS
ncbi:hypothetical protein EV174_005282 [Coemansia sp. RSA 2320]|nr:hypothetical protein EV174_005282 [Coemansia sp. RSA 2320]